MEGSWAATWWGCGRGEMECNQTGYPKKRVYEAVTSSPPLTTRQETPCSQTFHPVISPKHGSQL